MKTRFVTDINKIKYEVNMEVARMAFNGELDEHREEIAYNIIPGNTPQYRCCVYKEREIIRQRVRLAEGHTPLPGGNIKNIVQVLPAACEGCPINRFVLRTTVRCVWLKNVCPPAISERSPLKAAGPTSTRKNVRSAESVWKPVRTMPLPI